MTAYREGAPPPPEPPEPPDRDFERLARAARRKHLVLKYGPFAGAAVLLGIVALAQGMIVAVVAGAAFVLILALGKLSEVYESLVDGLFAPRVRVEAPPRRAPKVRVAPEEAAPEPAAAEEDESRKRSL